MMTAYRMLAIAAIAATAMWTSAPVKADGSLKDDPGPSVWTGLYGGVQLGYGWGHNEAPWGSIGAPLTDGNDPFDMDGFVGGAHLGVNWQSGDWVVGLEGDVELASISGGDGGNGGDVNDLEGDLMASGRLRVGRAVGPALLYLTGGFAMMNANQIAPDYPETRTETLSGWTIGGGYERWISDNITARIEYRYTDFRETVFTMVDPDYDIASDLELHAIRAGISMKF